MAPPPSSSSEPYDLVENKISPSILLIIVVLAIIFFFSGLLHLLVRYLLRATILTTRVSEEYPDTDTNVHNAASAIQGQLQQLFHLHDAGVDQSFIDTLPVFPYKSIVDSSSSSSRRRLKDPLDCAVCLCEFEPDDKLRLLPSCSHAFHTDCIDTWLLTHSACPLCRSTLSPTDQSSTSPSPSPSPILLLLESTSESFREDELETTRSSSDGEEMEVNLEEKRVVQVKLGKFRSSVGDDIGGGGSNRDQRRCFSMGSYEYEMKYNNLLQVAIKPLPSSMKTKLDHDGSRTRRLAVSECDCHSRRELGLISTTSTRLTSKKHDPVPAATTNSHAGSPRSKPPRAFSFPLPALPSESKAKAKSLVSEKHDAYWKWKKNGSEMDLEVEVGSCNNSVLSMGSQIEGVPSFARRTLLWIVGVG